MLSLCLILILKMKMEKNYDIKSQIISITLASFSNSLFNIQNTYTFVLYLPYTNKYDYTQHC